MVTALDALPSAPAGLCATCRHCTGCSLRGNAELAVWRCEEFDDGTPHAAASLSLAVPESEPARSNLPGLCGSCTAAEQCTFPNRDLGVWHCEEFE